MEKKRIDEIDILRGIAIILVIIGHSITKKPIDIQGTLWGSTLSNLIGSFHMALFFFIAGLVYHYNSNYKTYIIKKIKRIGIPLLIWGTFDILLHTLSFADDLTLSGKSSLLDEIIGMVFRGDRLWFFYVIFEIFLFYPFIDKLNIKWKCSIAMVCVILDLLFDLPSILCMYKLIYFLPFFIFGNIIPLDWDILKENDKSFLYWLVMFLCFITSIIIFVLYQLYDFEGFIVLYLLPALLIGFLVLAVVLTHNHIDYIDKFLKICSYYSAQLYILQFYTITIGRFVLFKYIKISNPVITLLILAIGSIVGILIVCKFFISRYKITRFIFGL